MKLWPDIPEPDDLYYCGYEYVTTGHGEALRPYEKEEKEVQVGFVKPKEKERRFGF